MLNKSLTIVLPVHNGESTLRRDVHEMLDLASELTAEFGILIVDDGSSDSTFEVAAVLAASYPQIKVKRQRHRGGLGPVMELVRRSVRSDAVMFHDGITPIDTNQMRSVWHRWIAQQGSEDARVNMSSMQEICDFADLPAIHAAMERSHGQVLGFHLVVPAHDTASSASAESAGSTNIPRSDAPHVARRRSVGQIPRLPRPKVLSKIADFALGE